MDSFAIAVTALSHAAVGLAVAVAAGTRALSQLPESATLLVAALLMFVAAGAARRRPERRRQRPAVRELGREGRRSPALSVREAGATAVAFR
jgi:peptidoglycan/LPS O-acetylase OafA/YrhL